MNQPRFGLRPEQQKASYSVVYNNTLTVSAVNGVLANDVDPNNLSLTASLVTGTSDGALSLKSDGSFTYIPNPGFIGSDSFTYKASDGQYASLPATVSITVDSTISGQVWLDSNQDGIENNGETGMSGVTVSLVLPDGAQASSTTTDANGDYQLVADPTLSSQYQVQVSIPTGDSATIPFASSSGIISSIDDAGYSNLLTLPSSGGINNVNAGLVSGAGPLASISGEVWLDKNDNGILDSGEAGLQSVNVNLLDSNNNVLNSSSTDANGDYSFFGLTPNKPYIIQFVAPSGYVFSPQNVGSPSTSSSADANGDTASITLTPGQNDTTINAGLYGSAPIVYSTSVPMTAENDSYTGIDFTAAGYDPNGKSLTPVIVQGPTSGSLVYNKSTGLYDYTAPGTYVGIDSFEFELNNGTAVSNVVTVQILAYGQELPLGTYNSFPLVVDGLFVPAGGNPDPTSVRQGQYNDCWLVAAADGFAQENPAQIKGLLTDRGGGDYSVAFPGRTPVIVNEVIWGVLSGKKQLSKANGDWLKALEMGYGWTTYYKENGSKWPPTHSAPYYLDTYNATGAGIQILSGNAPITNDLGVTSPAALRQNLTNAFNNNKVVTAITSDNNNLKAIGLVKAHIYTVVAYNAATDQIRLRNPWGDNPTYANPLGGQPAQIFRGYFDPEQPPFPALPDNNGYFWISLAGFQRLFDEIAFQK